MRLQGVKIIGYHGTASENVESILQNNYNLSGEKEWFGKGIYFFEDCSPLTDGFVEARDWVIHVKKFKKWAIFRAEIESKKSLDIVNDLVHKKIFKEIKEKLLSLHLESGRTKESFSDKVVFKKLELQAKFDLIRCTVNPEKSRVSFVVSRIQIQVCVKDKNCIKKNELVRGKKNA
ncbi:hypothetical protein IT568_07140 [bacterium]|nr:hypothetical protein [bacterium]